LVRVTCSTSFSSVIQPFVCSAGPSCVRDIPVMG
jgi:hypothetical protein